MGGGPLPVRGDWIWDEALLKVSNVECCQWKCLVAMWCEGVSVVLQSVPVGWIGGSVGGVLVVCVGCGVSGSSRQMDEGIWPADVM